MTYTCGFQKGEYVKAESVGGIYLPGLISSLLWAGYKRRCFFWERDGN